MKIGDEEIAHSSTRERRPFVLSAWMKLPQSAIVRCWLSPSSGNSKLTGLIDLHSKRRVWLLRVSLLRTICTSTVSEPTRCASITNEIQGYLLPECSRLLVVIPLNQDSKYNPIPQPVSAAASL